MRFTTKAITIIAALVFAGTDNSTPRQGGGGGGGGGGGSPGGGAPAGLITEFNPEQIAQAITAAGFPSKVITNNKSVVVLTAFWGDDVFSGTYGIFCNDKGHCGGAKMFANTGKSSVDAAWVNAWNNKYFFVRATQSEKGDLIFYWDLLLAGGVAPENVAVAATVFKNIVDSSTDFKP